jgi:hypothetical protein
MTKQTFDIEVIRIGYGSRTISVEAETYEQAQELALDKAGDYEYSEKSADYELADSPSKKLPTTIKYHSSGFVLGDLWGGGSGFYPTKKFSADSLEELLELNKAALADGSLDSGMGFERLLTAKLNITTETSVVIEGEVFTNNQYHHEYIGDEKYIDDLDQMFW